MSQPQAKLIVLEGPADPGPFFLAPDINAVAVGRDVDSSQILLPGDGVGDVHCRLLLNDRQWELAPVEGCLTYVDGQRLEEPREIEDLAIVDVGPYRLQFLLEEIEPHPPRPPRRQVRWSAELQASTGAGAPGGRAPEAARGTPPPPARGFQGADAHAGHGAGASRSSGRQAEPGAPGTSKVCECGQVISPTAGGYACAVCKRRYDLSGALVRKGTLAAGTALLRNPKTWLVVGATALAVMGMGVVISQYTQRGAEPAGSADADEPELAVVSPLPPQASRLLDVVVRSAVLRPLIGAGPETRPTTVGLSRGQALTIRLEHAPHSLRTAKAWEAPVKWEADMPSLSGDLDGLAVELQDKVVLGEKTLEAGVFLLHEGGGWHIARAAGAGAQAK